MNDLSCPACAARGHISLGCHRCEGTGETCGTCGGMGYRYSSENPMESRLVPCECGMVVRRERAAMEAVSALRGRLLSCTFDNFDLTGPAAAARASWEAARRWVGKQVGWLLMHGSKGNGKSHLAAAAVNALIEQGEVPLFINVPEFLDWLRETYDREGDDSDSAHRRLERVKRARWLVMDDVGAEKSSPWTQEKLYMLCNYRLEMLLPTLWTTNVETLEQLESRLRSRLQDRGLCEVVLNPAPDYRTGKGRVTR